MFINIAHVLKEEKTSIGAALTITGIPLGMYLDFFFRIRINWTVLFMALSLLLVLDRQNVFRKRIIVYSQVFSWIIILQILMILYGFVSERMTSQFFSYHLYVLGLLYAYLSVTDFSRYDKVVQWIYITSIPSILFGVVCCLTGLASVEGEQLFKQTFGEDAYNLDPLTISSGVLNAFFSLFCFLKKDRRWKFFMVVTTILGGYVLLDCGKRTPMLILMIGIVVFCYMKGYRIKISPSAIKGIYIVTLLMIVSYFEIEFVNEKVNSIVLSTYEGLRGLFVNETRITDIPLSVYERIQNREWAVNYILNDFKWYNYILGGGYFLNWIDFPILQSYLELGMLGCFLFFMIVVLYPLRVILMKINDVAVIFGVLISLYPMFAIISSGTPYHPNSYVSVMMLAMFCQQYCNANNENESRLLDI